MGAFDELKGMMKPREAVEMTDCPNCGYSLSKQKTTGILHCPLCGWTENLSQSQEVT